MKKDGNNEKNHHPYSSSGLAVGLCLGVACGIAFDNLAFGIGLGLCFGAAFGTMAQKKQESKDKKQT